MSSEPEYRRVQQGDVWVSRFAGPSGHGQLVQLTAGTDEVGYVSLTPDQADDVAGLLTAAAAVARAGGGPGT